MWTCSTWMRRSRGWRHSMPARVNLPSCASSEDCHSKRLARHSGSRLPPPSGTGRQPGRGCSRSSGVSDEMTPERWRQVTEILHTARACSESVRASYLDRACIGDLALRKEVDAMLAADSAGAHFGEDPVNASAVHLSRLASGAMIGAYRIVELIGKGGMGEVYRARDTRLGRDVAFKILPAAFVVDPDRRARFEREARVLASLNHPNIAAIYGLEESDDTRALVMELVEGETLAERIARGSIPLDEVLPIAKQIAEALEAAHEQGIIHRDLKPSNIKLRPDRTVKVLDFGLAKALDPAPTGVDASQSPTITNPAITGMGIILGTAAYMSPEQAKGRPADKRSDICAFGCVLYEMLTNKRAFAGNDVGDTLAFVITKELDWDALPADTPSAVRRLLRRCLRKDIRDRLRDIGDARIEMQDAEAEASQGTTLPVPIVGRRGRERLAWAAAAVAMVLAAVVASVGYFRRAEA